MPNKYQGLSNKEAQKRLEKHGPNQLPETPPPSSLSIFISQLKSPLVYILLVATFVTLSLGHYTDSFVIALAVFVNTILGFVQEKRANNSLYALKQLLHPKAVVIREGKRITIDATESSPVIIVYLHKEIKFQLMVSYLR